MNAKNKRARDGWHRSSPKDSNRPNSYTPQAQPRQYPEGWSRWVEPEAPCYADDFIED